MIYVNGYPIDCALSESLTYESEVTQHPVENGADVTDHIRAKLPVLRFEGLVTDTPIGLIARDATRTTLEGDQRPSGDAYARFVAIHGARRPVVVRCSYGEFASMALESLTTSRTGKEAKAFKFSATFRRIEIVSNTRSATRPSSKNGSKKQSFGLSLDKVVNGERILWRKGRPPGTSPATDPAGVIVGQEAVLVKAGKFLHADGKRPLTTAELTAFAADLDRDSALQQRRALKRADEKIASIGDRLDRANALLDYKNAHPGERVDPALFGL